MMKPKTKKVKKWKQIAEELWNILDSIDTLPDMIHPNDLEGHEKCWRMMVKRAEKRHELLKTDGFNLATQPQPIKESKTLIEKCPNCIEPDENIKPMPDGSCGVCGGKGYIEWEKVGKIIYTPSPQEESKDIEFEEIKKIKNQDSNGYLTDVHNQIITIKINEVIDTLNSLTKRNIK